MLVGFSRRRLGERRNAMAQSYGLELLLSWSWLHISACVCWAGDRI